MRQEELTDLTKEDFAILQGLINDFEGKEDSRCPAHRVTEMFNLHNRIWRFNQEYSKSCCGCRARIWAKLKDWYHNNKGKYGK